MILHKNPSLTKEIHPYPMPSKSTVPLVWDQPHILPQNKKGIVRETRQTLFLVFKRHKKLFFLVTEAGLGMLLFLDAE